MEAINQIIKQIEQKGASEIQEYLETNKEKLISKYNIAAEKLDAEYKENYEKLKITSIKNHDNQLQQIENENKREVLNFKNQLRQSLKQEVLEQTKNFSSEQIEKMIIKATKKIDSGLIKLGANSNVSKNFKVANFEISQDKIANQTGFIIEKNGIEYNYLFQTIIEELNIGQI